MAAARGFAGRLCATPTSRATSRPRRMSKKHGTVSTASSSRASSSRVSMSTLTNATSGKAAERSRNFGWNRTQGAHHVAVMFTHARGEAASASRSAAASTAVVGADAVAPIWGGGLAPRLRRPCSVRTSHPNAPEEDAEPASPGGRRGAVTTPDAGAAHHGAGGGASSAMSRADECERDENCGADVSSSLVPSPPGSEVSRVIRGGGARATAPPAHNPRARSGRHRPDFPTRSPGRARLALTPPPRLAMSSSALSSTSSLFAGARRGLVPDEPRASRRRAARVAVVVRASSTSEERRKAAECTRRGLLSSGKCHVTSGLKASTTPTCTTSSSVGRRSTVPSFATASAPPPRR